MKRTLALLLAAILMFAFVACKEENEKDNSESESKNTSQAEESSENAQEPEEDIKAEGLDDIINSADYSADKEAPKFYDGTDLKSVETVYELKNLSNKQVVKSIKLEETQVEFYQTTVADFLAAGWTIEGGKTAESDVKAHIITNAFVKNAAGKKAAIYAVNLGENTIAFSECVISGIIIEYNLNATANFDVAGADKNSDYADITAALGKPQRLAVTEFYEGDNYRDSTVRVYYDLEEKGDNRSDTQTIEFEFKDDGKVLVMERFTCKTSSIIKVKK